MRCFEPAAKRRVQIELTDEPPDLLVVDDRRPADVCHGFRFRKPGKPVISSSLSVRAQGRTPVVRYRGREH